MSNGMDIVALGYSTVAYAAEIISVGNQKLKRNVYVQLRAEKDLQNLQFMLKSQFFHMHLLVRSTRTLNILDKSHFIFIPRSRAFDINIFCNCSRAVIQIAICSIRLFIARSNGACVTHPGRGGLHHQSTARAVIQMCGFIKITFYANLSHPLQPPRDKPYYDLAFSGPSKQQNPRFVCCQET